MIHTHCSECNQPLPDDRHFNTKTCNNKKCKTGRQRRKQAEHRERRKTGKPDFASPDGRCLYCRETLPEKRDRRTIVCKRDECRKAHARYKTSQYIARNKEKALKSRREAQARYVRNHPEKAAAQRKSWAEKNPDRFYKSNYKIDSPTMEQMLIDQGGRCAICNATDPKGRGWQLDHDHTCCPTTKGFRKTCGNCIRGILCSRCNTALGLLDDNIATMQRAIAYVERGAKLELTT